MYSPKINEELIPVLYRLAKERKIFMTKLVNEILEGYLADCGKMEEPVPNLPENKKTKALPSLTK